MKLVQTCPDLHRLDFGYTSVAKRSSSVPKTNLDPEETGLLASMRRC